tara:strand:- start:3288 stop:3656 length:369 start_codon:yes stop_codon:yes gene_type:complete
MKTSSKVILENISINKDLRMNINLIDDSTLRELFNKVNHHIDEFNHEKLNESEKIFMLQEIIKSLFSFSNVLFDKFFQLEISKTKETAKVKKLKSFIDVTKNNNDDESELSKIKQLQRRLQT